MWRSVTRASLHGNSKLKLSSSQKILYLIQPPISNLPSRAPNLQNPRFFSSDSSNPSHGSHFHEEPISISQQFLSSNEEIDGSVEEINGSSEEIDGSSEGIDVSESDLEKFEEVLSLLQSSVNEPLESSLESMALRVNEDFMVRVFETPLINGENLIEFFKWVCKKPDILITTRVVDSLVRAICSGNRRKEAYHLWDLVKEIGEKDKNLLNAEILNVLISMFVKLAKGKAAFEVFNKFGDFGCVPNADSYYLTFEVLCKRSLFDWAWSVCENMINVGIFPSSEKIAKMVCCLCKGDKFREAHLVYLAAKDDKKNLPRSCLSFLISSLCGNNETVKLALEMLDDFEGRDREYAIKPFSSVIRGLCRINDLDGAKSLLDKMIKVGPPPGGPVFNMVINGLSKAGEMEEALRVMRLMESRGLKPDVYTYSVIMSGFAKGGLMDEACKVLSEAKKNHSKLSPITYHILIRGYCKLEEFDKALELLAEMKEFGVQPKSDEYEKLIQSLCLKALDWEASEKLLAEMEEKGLHPNASTRSLIRAVKELEEEEGVESEEVSLAA